MEPSRAPSSIWSLRHPGTYPNAWVRTIEGDRIEVTQVASADFALGRLVLSRRDARLLARRLNECLDATVKP